MPCYSVNSSNVLAPISSENRYIEYIFTISLALTIIAGIGLTLSHLEVIDMGALDLDFHLMAIVLCTPLLLSTIAFGCLLSLDHRDNEGNEPVEENPLPIVECKKEISADSDNIKAKSLENNTIDSSHPPSLQTNSSPSLPLQNIQNFSFINRGLEEGFIQTSSELVLLIDSTAIIKAPIASGEVDYFYSLFDELVISQSPDPDPVTTLYDQHTFLDLALTIEGIIMLGPPRVAYWPPKNYPGSSKQSPHAKCYAPPKATKSNANIYVQLPSKRIIASAKIVLRNIILWRDSSNPTPRKVTIVNCLDYSSNQYNKLVTSMINLDKHHRKNLQWLIQAKHQDIHSCALLALYYFMAKTSDLCKSSSTKYTLNLHGIINSFSQQDYKFFNVPSDLLKKIINFAKFWGFKIVEKQTQP